MAEAARNLSCVGAEPLAVTDCLNFGNPEKPAVFYQMESAVNGISDACSALGVPVVSGNVSLYNETESGAVLPTPVIGMLGLLEDVSKRAGSAFRDNLAVGLLWDKQPSAEAHGGGMALLGASQYVETTLGLKAGMPPTVDFRAERSVQYAARDAIRAGLLDVAHDCSDGGLAVCVAECCITGAVGATLWLDELDEARPGMRSDVLLFAEEASRIVVALGPERWNEMQELADTLGARLYRLGSTGGDTLRIERGERVLVDVAVAQADGAWRGGLQ